MIGRNGKAKRKKESKKFRMPDAGLHGCNSWPFWFEMRFSTNTIQCRTEQENMKERNVRRKKRKKKEGIPGGGGHGLQFFIGLNTNRIPCKIEQ
jgi:hypothetical protein